MLVMTRLTMIIRMVRMLMMVIVVVIVVMVATTGSGGGGWRVGQIIHQYIGMTHIVLVQAWRSRCASPRMAATSCV